MSTRSMIAIENSDGTLDAVYCHSDGYLEHVGFVLYAFYNTPEKVKALISLGAMSWLGYRIGKPFSLNKCYTDSAYFVQYQNQCAPYYDCGKEKKKEICHYKSRNSLYKIDCIDFVYIFRNGAWYVKYHKVERLVKLEQQLKTSTVRDYLGKSQYSHLNYNAYVTEAEAMCIHNAYKKLGVIPENSKFEYCPVPLF